MRITLIVPVKGSLKPLQAMTAGTVAEIVCLETAKSFFFSRLEDDLATGMTMHTEKYSTSIRHVSWQKALQTCC